MPIHHNKELGIMKEKYKDMVRKHESAVHTIEILKKDVYKRDQMIDNVLTSHEITQVSTDSLKKCNFQKGYLDEDVMNQTKKPNVTEMQTLRKNLERN